MIEVRVVCSMIRVNLNNYKLKSKNISSFELGRLGLYDFKLDVSKILKNFQFLKKMY